MQLSVEGEDELLTQHCNDWLLEDRVMAWHGMGNPPAPAGELFPYKLLRLRSVMRLVIQCCLVGVARNFFFSSVANWMLQAS